MKKFIITCIIFLLPVSANCLEDAKNIQAKKELHEYDTKRKEINNECKIKRKQIYDKLSFEAQKLIHERKQKHVKVKTDLKKPS